MLDEHLDQLITGDESQHHSGSTSVSDATLTAMQATLEGMDLGPLLGLYLQTFVVQITMLALSAIIFVFVYGRMLEIYLMIRKPWNPSANRERR